MGNKILIVDDDKEMCKEIKEVLCDEGYDVSMSHDGLEGYSLIKEGGFDLVLLDVRLPHMNGLEILKSVREMKNNVGIIVITGMPLSGGPTEEHRKTVDQALETLKLANAVLSKPFSMQKMISAVREVIESPSV